MFTMFSSWLHTSIRNLYRRKSFTAINLICLACGLACTLYAAMFISDEFSFDKFHDEKDRIYRISTTNRFGDQENRYSTTSAPLADAIRTDIPEVEETARLYSRQGSVQLLLNNQAPDPAHKFRETDICFADPQLFNILKFDFIAGSKRDALSNPSQAILTRKLAVRYFGSVEDAVGKTILFEAQIPLTISAVVEDFPAQSHLTVNLITHFENYYTIESGGARDFLRRDWLYNPVSTYVKVGEGHSPDEVTVKINALVKRYGDDRVKQGVSFQLQPIIDIHLYSDFSFQGGAANIRQVVVLGAISAFILIIACVNFINLSTVGAIRRAREMGMRKVLGATRQGLVRHALAESGVLVIIALVIAIVIISLVLPYTEQLTGKNLLLAALFTPFILFFVAALVVITTVLAGGYPAFFIAKFSPAKTLKGLVTHSFKDGITLRRGLVVLQFSITVILIVFTLTIRSQLDFMNSKPLGFNKELMVTIPIFSDNPNSIIGSGVDGPMRARMNEFENKLLEHPSVEAVTVSSVLPGYGAIPALVVNDKYKATDNIFIPVVSVDYDFIDAYSITLLSGRGFSREFGTDHMQAFIINEEAVKELGWSSPEVAIGQPLDALDKQGTVVGVVRNYHFEGLQQKVRPLILEVAASKFTSFTVRLTNNNIAVALPLVQSKWNNAFPERVFEYHFLDEQLDRMYARDQQSGKLVGYFSIMAIVLSCMGLFGLAAYVNYLRVREVSIRKVLGASIGQVFNTLSWEFIRTTLIAFTIAIPLSYWLASKWLEDFAYSSGIGWLPFGLAFGAVSLVVFMTIFFQTLRTARVNPATVLKQE